MRPAIRTTAAAAAIAAALALGAAPAAASRCEEGVTTRIAQRIENQGFFGFLWTFLTGIWAQDGGNTTPGG